MSEYLVLLLVQITIFSSVTALLLLAVKFLFRRRIPPELSLLLWLILLVRMMLPVLPESALSIYNLVPGGRQIQYTLIHDMETGIEMDLDVSETAAENPYRFHAEQTAESKQNSASVHQNAIKNGRMDAARNWPQLRKQLCTIVLVVYGWGVLLTGVFHRILYEHVIRRVYRNSFRCEDPRILQIYTETAAAMRIMDRRAPLLRLGSSTMLAGIFTPCVILRQEDRNLSGEGELRMIFLHELNHFKHKDNWILLLSTIFCVIFWYNPLLWLVRKLLREDIEVLCDARTLENRGIEAGEYARMLCRSSHLPELTLLGGTAMSASGRTLKRRLLLIGSRRKGVFLPRFVSVFLCIVMVALCLTNPMVSAESAYTPYIENLADMTGDSMRDITLSEQVTVQQFLQWMDGVLVYAGGDSLSRKAGGGDLDALLRLSRSSPYVSAEVAEAAGELMPEDRIDRESCAVLLACVIGLLGEGRYDSGLPVLPEMLSAEAMESLCSHLTKAEKEAVLACYNLGVDGADVSFSYVYTEAMMKLILSRVQDDWLREKLAVYYQKVNLSARDLDKINAYLNNTVRYVGIGRDFYICDPELARFEEETLREILGAAYAGQREDVYYRKQTEDDCSFTAAAVLLARAGMEPSRYQDEYALLGETAYIRTESDSFFLSDGSVWVNALQLDAYTAKLQNEYLDAAIRDRFVYHDKWTYTMENGEESTISMRYYRAAEGQEELCRNILLWMTEQLNAVAFARTGTVGEIPSADSPGILEACTLAAEMGLIRFDSQTESADRPITGSQCARILCHFLAAMQNAY